MSVLHLFLKEINLEDENSETSPPLHRDNSAPIYVALLIGLCFLLLALLCCKAKTKDSQFPSLNFTIYIQNIFQNPAIRNVHFHQGDQMVPSGPN